MPFAGSSIHRILFCGALLSAAAAPNAYADRLAPNLLLAQAAPVATAAQERGYIARRLHDPVPGGVAVVSLGPASQAPVVHYGDSRMMVVKDSNDEWVALVGIDLKAKAGRHEIKVQGSEGSRTQPFDVGH